MTKMCLTLLKIKQIIIELNHIHFYSLPITYISAYYFHPNHSMGNIWNTFNTLNRRRQFKSLVEWWPSWTWIILCIRTIIENKLVKRELVSMQHLINEKKTPLPKEWTVTTNTDIGSFLVMVIKIASESLQVKNLLECYRQRRTEICSYYFRAFFLSHFELLRCQFLLKILTWTFALTRHVSGNI